MSVPVPPFYATADLGTEIYDAVAEVRIAGSSVGGDVEFFRASARRTGGPILDVGCGTGRVSIPLAADGWEVVGLDRSAPMLALAERRRAAASAEVAARFAFVEADMADFNLARTFALIVVPFRVFQFLLTPETQRSGLAALRRHLAPGGELVLDLFDPRLDLCLPDVPPPAGNSDLVKHPGTGNDVRVERLERVNDPVRQVFAETWESTEVDAAGRVLRSIRETLSLRWTYRWEMRHLLELSGFEVVAELGDFRGSPPTYGREQVWVVRAKP
jgi:SAM-dependent methyltransferase